MGAACSAEDDIQGGGTPQGSKKRPWSFNKLRVVVKHAPIDSTNSYQFWVVLSDRSGDVLVSSLKKRCGSDQTIQHEIENLPQNGAYFCQLMTGNRKETTVRGKIDVYSAATLSADGEWAELCYTPIIPNEWVRGGDETLLTINVSTQAEETKSKKIWFRVVDAEDEKALAESKKTKTVVNDGTNPTCSLHSWVQNSGKPMNVEMYAGGRLFGSPKPFRTFRFPQIGAVTTAEIKDANENPIITVRANRSKYGLGGPTTVLNLKNLCLHPQ